MVKKAINLIQRYFERKYGVEVDVHLSVHWKKEEWGRRLDESDAFELATKMSKEFKEPYKSNNSEGINWCEIFGENSQMIIYYDKKDIKKTAV